VTAPVTNAGKREGAEAAQLYPGYPPAAEEPPKQLPGFERVRLKPGESKAVTMERDKKSLGAWDSNAHDCRVYAGSYSVLVGSSSRDIRLKGAFTIGN
jgi:beta-glucosidase